MDSKVIALIVTYNRINFLRRCIEKVQQQSISPLPILIIDNASTDDTEKYLRQLHSDKKIIYCRLSKNIGGAGGFSFGIQKAISMGYAHIWLMDDDTMAETNTLYQLLESAREEPDYGFLVSLPIWKDNSLCKMNLPLLNNIWKQQPRTLYKGMLSVQKATFVSMLLNVNAVKSVGLPIKEFFIWGDDQEYSYRISRKYPCFLVLTSCVIHEMNRNCGSDIVHDEKGRWERYQLAYRNEFYIAKKKGILSVFAYFYRVLRVISQILIKSDSHKLERARIVLKGVGNGFFFNPEIEYIGNRSDL